MSFSEIGVYRPSIEKDPDATLDYSWDWTDWLAAIPDTIASYSVSVSGVTKESDARVGAVVTVWVSGGTAGTVASATCHIVTTGGREEDRTIYFRVQER